MVIFKLNYTDDDDEYGLLELLPPEAKHLYRLVQATCIEKGTTLFTLQTGTKCEGSEFVYLFSVEMSTIRNCCEESGAPNDDHDHKFDSTTAHNHFYAVDRDIDEYLAKPGTQAIIILFLNSLSNDAKLYFS